MDIKDKIYDFLSEQLTLGNIKKQDKITEQFLVDNIGISRTPIREALFQLTAEDILEREVRKGFKLKQFTKNDLENYYTLIGTLDGKILELTIETLTNNDYAMMQFLIDSMDSAIKNKLYTKYNFLQEQFHDVYIDQCTNLLLINEIKVKKKVFIGKAYSNVSPTTLQEVLLQTNNEHKELLKMIKEKRALDARIFLENVHWRKENVEYDIW